MSVKDKILVVDDEPAFCELICESLRNAAFEVASADTVCAASEVYRRMRPNLVVMDHGLPDGNALELMRQLRSIDRSLPVVILTGHGTIDLAVQAIKEGAEQFLTKPVDLAVLRIVIRRAIENTRNRQKQLADCSRRSHGYVDPFVGSSAAIRQLRDRTQRVLDTAYPVLILGETGVGKGVLARWLHEHSNRSREALVDFNCAGLARDLLETELFGHERGAFTGAVGTKLGLFEVAHRGTMFLDEIGDMDLPLQPKLLKVVEEHRFRRLGDVKDRAVDIRLIAATHRDLGALIHENKFRADLYFRLNTFSLAVPPLRERREDIPALAEDILNRTAADLGRIHLQIDEDAIDLLTTYTWPGNVRELRNVLERAALLCDEERISRRHLHFEATGKRATAELNNLTLDEVQRQHIERVLALENGNVPRAAIRLGIPRSTLYYLLKKFNAADAAAQWAS